MGKSCRYTVSALALSVLLVGTANAADPQDIDVRDRADELGRVASEAEAVLVFDPERKFVIDGERVVENWLIAAKEIVFEPGSKLVFSENARRLRDEFFLVAQKIVVNGQEKPPVITWQKPTLNAPTGRGQAATGSRGAGAGAHGTPGAPGAQGSNGFDGIDAPSLTIMARGISGSTFVVDLSGAVGGPGGAGQTGGDGGNGATGRNAANERVKLPFGGHTAVGCARGPGHGGNGGNGGAGGTGGTGGLGGRGGDVTIVSEEDAIPTFSQLMRIDLSGGQGGPGGQPGKGGKPGAGGPEGPRTSWCSPAGRNGHGGAAGQAGSAGAKGNAGQAGDFYVGRLSQSQFAKLFGF